MTQTVFGQLADKVGHAHDGERFWSSPAGHYRSVQNGRIPVDVNHDGHPVGELVHLERRHGNLLAVGHIHDDIRPEIHVRVAEQTVTLEHPLYWSATRVGGPDVGLGLISVALVTATARITARPVRLLPGHLNFMRQPPASWNLETHERSLLTNACETIRSRRELGHDTPLVIGGGLDDPSGVPTWRSHGQAPGHVEYRSAASVDISRSRRELDLVIAPAETPTVIHERGKRYVEVISHGAFAGAERNPEAVRLNRDHVREKVIGKALNLDPWDEEGLVGTVKLAKTPAADEALALIDDGLLGVSAGFVVPGGGDQWSGDQRRVRRAVLDHVSLVVEAAYPLARVTAARSLTAA